MVTETAFIRLLFSICNKEAAYYDKKHSVLDCNRNGAVSRCMRDTFALY